MEQMNNGNGPRILRGDAQPPSHGARDGINDGDVVFPIGSPQMK